VTEVSSRGRVGPDTLGDGAEAKIRQGRNAEQVVQDLHGRFYEQTFRANVYCGGMGLTAINAATFTSATLDATETPIAGVWNPSASQVNLVIIEATLGLTMTALAATGGGPYVWATSTGNGVITTGAQPFNRKTLLRAGSSARDMTGLALTGLTTNMIVRFGSSLFGGSAENAAFTATAVAMQTQQQAAKEYFNGSLIVPPGGVLALLATTTPVAHSAVSALVWEEVPI
jgi:hypothetical protein